MCLLPELSYCCLRHPPTFLARAGPFFFIGIGIQPILLPAKLRKCLSAAREGKLQQQLSVLCAVQCTLLNLRDVYCARRQ
jgi:hypothetical protein